MVYKVLTGGPKITMRRGGTGEPEEYNRLGARAGRRSRLPMHVLI